MFHLFTLQGKRIDAPLEHIPRNFRVHHAGINNRVKKYREGDSSGNLNDTPGNPNYGADTYKEAVNEEYEKTPVFHASEIMSSPVISIGPEVKANDVWLKFKDKRIHHMPVTSDDGKLIGIISDRDFLKKFSESGETNQSLTDIRVKDIMSTDVIATALLTDIRRVARAMLVHHIGAMPVVDDNGSLTGIITRSDILRAIIHQPELKFWA